jgi:hypothetical protein
LRFKEKLNIHTNEIDAAIVRLNKVLSPLSFQIGSTSFNQQTFYVLHNLKDDSAAKFGSRLNGNELDYFKKIV